MPLSHTQFRLFLVSLSFSLFFSVSLFHFLSVSLSVSLSLSFCLCLSFFLSQQQQDVQDLYEGKIRWINVPFPADPAWAEEESYVNMFEQYHGLYENTMPMVPALMTYCEVPLMEDEDGQNHSVRIHYRTWVLKPIRWVIHKDHDGLCAFIGNETPGQFTVEMETEEIVKFSSCIEFSAAVSASGGYGPVMGSVGLKTSIGAWWEKTSKVTTKGAMTVEQGCSYQPTRIYAKLLCKVVHAKAGEFLANGFGEFVTTNKRHEPVAANHKASNSTYVKPVTDLRRLYDAFGKEVSISRKERGFLWSKVISIKIKIKVVVDPADGRLYVTGTASRFMNHKILPARFSRWRIRSRMAANERSVVVLANGLGSLRDYRGLCAKDSMPDDKVITYSPGDLVKVWKVAVKGKRRLRGPQALVAPKRWWERFCAHD